VRHPPELSPAGYAKKTCALTGWTAPVNVSVFYILRNDFRKKGLTARHDETMLCKARQGKARQGKARQGKARQGKARQGKARQGKARQGKARQGKALSAVSSSLSTPFRKNTYISCGFICKRADYAKFQNIHIYNIKNSLVFQGFSGFSAAKISCRLSPQPGRR
jgi:hypothetical protein